MALWNSQKWGTFRWGNTVPSDSEIALLRAVVAGATSWLPPPALDAPNGGEPSTGTAAYRHATVRIFLLNETDWTDKTEFVGVITGSRTSQLSGPIQQDALQFTLYDPTEYYTDGEGALLLWDGNLVRVQMEITSPGGTIVSKLGVYRLIGFPEVQRSRGGTQLTVNGVEWFRDLLSNAYSSPQTTPGIPAYLGAVPRSPDDATAWPTNAGDLVADLFSAIANDSLYQAWATEQFTNQRVHDFDDGDGPQQVWLYAPFSVAAVAIWMLLGRGTYAHDRIAIDRNLKDPFGGFYLTGSGVPSQDMTLSADFAVKQPEWRDVLAQLVNYIPYQVVMGGDGTLHIRNPGGRYVTPFVVSCESSAGGTIPLPVESLDHKTDQPEFTETARYTQINSGASSGYLLNSTARAPSRFSKFPRREVTVVNTINTDTIDTGPDPSTQLLEVPPVVTVPTVDDGTALPRMLEIMRQADTVTITLDSAFPYIKLQDEIKIQMPGCRGFYTVTSVTQPFDTGAMTLQLAWRDDN